MDLTIKNEYRTMIYFTIPILFSEIIQRACILTDNMIAGKAINESALAAIGLISPVTIVFTSILLGMSYSVSILVSQAYGKKNFSAMKTIISTIIIVSLSFSVLAAGFGLVFSRKLVGLAGVSDDIYELSLIYLKTYLLSYIFRCLFQICMGILIAIGDSRKAFACLSILSFINIILDIWMVLYLRLGISGIAMASFCSYFIMAAVSSILLRLIVKKIYDEKCKTFSLVMIKDAWKLYIPNIFQQIIFSSGDVYMLRRINGYGTMAVAGYTAALQVNMLLFTCINAISMAVLSYTAQNIGAGKVDRVKKGFRFGIIISLFFCIPFLAAGLLFPEWLLTFFLDRDRRETLFVGVDFLRITAPFYSIVCLKQLIDGLLRGSGIVFYPFLIASLDLLQRMVLVGILPYRYGLNGLFFTFPTGWLLAAILYVMLYEKGRWKDNRNIILRK